VHPNHSLFWGAGSVAVIAPCTLTIHYGAQMTDSGDAPSFECLRLSVDGAVAVLELHRPASLNPLSTAAMEEIIAAARWFDDQTPIKVVIVRGAGRVFSAGADVTSFGGPGAATGRHAADVGRRMADAVEAMRAVTIAQIHGWCVGGGVVLASACDLRLVAADAQFSIPEVDLGIPLAWGGIPRLVREIGPALAKELVMTCRPFGADEAARIGFVNRVVPADELESAVATLAQNLASKATYALLSTKRYVNAVTSQMVGLDRSWSDADTLVAGLHDPEGQAKQAEYLARLAVRRRERSS
jgi:enoyl-CoA hydratase/carnithine racemase